MAIEFRHGWNPTPDHVVRLRMDDALDGAAAPAQAYYYTIPSIGMLGNDEYGDCVFAGDGHIVEQQTAIGQTKETTVTTAQALAAYTAVTGFNPKDPNTDQGALISDGLAYLRKTGLAGVKIAAYGQVAVGSMDKIKLAVAEFGAVSIGLNFPNSAMDQFNNSQPWDVVPDDGGIDGGHCVIVCGYDATYLYVYTWGAIQKVTYAFWAKYVEEAWPVVTQVWVNTTTGLDPEGVDLGVLGSEFTAVTGQPSPFPDVPTPPAPTPPGDPDGALAVVLETANALGQRWVDQRHSGYVTKVAKAGVAWLAAKGL